MKKRHPHKLPRKKPSPLLRAFSWVYGQSLVRYSEVMYVAPHPDSSALHGVSLCINSGARGVRQTLAVMRSLVRQYRTDLGLLSTARNLIFLAPEKDEMAEAECLFRFVRDQIRYTRDIHDVETVSSPDKTLAFQCGDCDDKTTLLATLAECVGFPTRFVVTGYSAPGQYEHVYLQLLVNNRWVSADPTEPQNLGWEPPGAVARMIEGK